MSFFGGKTEGSISEFRRRYPQYDDLDDSTLAEALYKTSYADLDHDAFIGEFLGKETPPAWNQDKAPEPDWNREDDQVPQAVEAEPQAVEAEPEVAEPTTTPFTNNGQQYDVPLDGYASKEEAIDAFLEGNNEPLNITQAPEGAEVGATIEPEPEPAEPAPTDLSDFGVTDDQLNARPQEEEPEVDAVTGPQKPTTPAEKDGISPFMESSFADPKDKMVAWTGGVFSKQALESDKSIEEVDPNSPGYLFGRVAAFAGRKMMTTAGELERRQDAKVVSKYSMAQGPFQLALSMMTSLTEKKLLEKHDQVIPFLKEEAEKLLETADETKPKAEDGLAAATGMVLTDAIDGIVNMATSVGTAKITKSANLGLGVMGMEVFDETYARTKSETGDPVEAFYKATRQTLYEVGPEKLFGFFDKLGGKGVRDWAMQSLREAASEMLTSTLEQLDETFVEGKAWPGWIAGTKRALYDGLIGLLMGGGLSVGMLFGGKGKDTPSPIDEIGELADTFLPPPDDPGGDIETNENRSNRSAKELLAEIQAIYEEHEKAKKIEGSVISKRDLDTLNRANKEEVEELLEKLSRDFAPHMENAEQLEALDIKIQEVREMFDLPIVGGDDEEEKDPNIKMAESLGDVDATGQNTDPALLIKNRTHDDMLLNPIYKKLFDASDLGELSQDQATREAAAREAYIRKARKIQNWQPKLDAEKEMRESESGEEQGTIEAARKDREDLNKEKELDDSLLPEGYDPLELIYTNIDGEIIEYTIDEAAKVVTKFDEKDKNNKLGADQFGVTVTEKDGKKVWVNITRAERDQLSEQLDEYRSEFEANETVDSPRSEARESLPNKTDNTFIESVATSELITDPITFQYKSGTDDQGVSKRLKGVKKWSRTSAGVLLVWQDIKGQRVVADGHQRFGALKALQAQGKELDTKLDIRVFSEADGYTSEDVRTIASEANIAQGSGTAIDAAKVLRYVGESIASDVIQRLPPNSALVRDAIGLSKLNEEAFQVVVNDLIEPRYGSMVGQSFEDSEQLAAMQILIKSKPSTFSEATAMIADIQAGGFVKSEQGGLFGDSEMESLIKERAQIIASAESGLKKDVATFNALVKNEEKITNKGDNKLDTETNKAIVEDAKSVMERALKTINTNPELNDDLNKLALNLAAGTTTRAKAAKQFVEAARAYTERSSRDSSAKPVDEGTGEAGGKQTPKAKEKTKKPVKKKPSEIKLETEMEVEETGEVVTISENAAHALVKLDKRILALKRLEDCIKS